MFRMRRYRVFIAFAIIAILAFYTFSGYDNWTSTSSAIGAGSLRQAGIPPSVKHDNPPERPPVNHQDSFRPDVSKEKDDIWEEEAVYKQPVPEKTKQTAIVQTISSPAANPDHYDKLVSVHTSSIPVNLEDHKPAVTPPPPIPSPFPYEIDLDDSNDEPFVKSTSSVTIHWSKQPEHFPISSTIQLPIGTPKSMPRIQHKFTAETEDEKIDRKQKLATIKEAAARSWKGYTENAFLHDEVKPVSGKFKDPFCGWAATLVDSLDTLWIMGLKDEFDHAVRAVGTIDFTTSPRKDIPLFETTIRYLGGLLSAYDLSEGRYITLLDKAVELAEVLMGAFDTPNRMPMTFYQWTPAFASQPHRAGSRVVMAELGSLSMEFTRLAQITKEPKYYDAIDRVTDAFYEWQNNSVNGTLVPGLFSTHVDASGCEKPPPPKPKDAVSPFGGGAPLTSFEEIAYGPGTHAVVGEPVQAQKKPSLDSANSGKISAGQGQPGKVGKIAGWDDPYQEGSLDTKAAKNAALEQIGSQLDSEPAPVKPVGKLGKIEGWEGPNYDSDPYSTAEKDLSSSEKADKMVGSVDEVAELYGSVGSDDSSAAKKELYDEIYRDTRPGGSKNKRQLGGELADESPRLSKVEHPNTGTSTFEEQTKPNPPKASGSDICIPHGLSSSARQGSDSFTLGGMADSTYEYLPKQYLLLGGLEEKYRNMYEKAMDAAIEKLLFRPMTPDNQDILFSGEYLAYNKKDNQGKDGKLKPEAAHLTCFAGAMFAMGGKIFDRKEDIEIGSKLTDGCVWAYNVTATGIMPEMALLSVCEDAKNCEWNQTKYWHEIAPFWETKNTDYHGIPAQKHPGSVPPPQDSYEIQAQADTSPRKRLGSAKQALGDSILNKRQRASPGQIYPKVQGQDEYVPPTRTSTQSDEEEPFTLEEVVLRKIKEERLPLGFTKIVSRKYILRPEAIESVFYMWRITGDSHWREVGWNMFQAIQTYTHAEYGNSAISDVTTKTPYLDDSEESFWLAETLKYFFLLFSEDSVISLDEWVLNTEAHPFRRPDAPVRKAANAGTAGGV